MNINLDAVCQEDLSRLLYAYAYQKGDVAVNSLMATILRNGVRDCSKFREATFLYDKDGNTPVYKACFGVLYTIDKDMIYCSRFIRTNIDTAYVYVFIGKVDSIVFDFLNAKYFKDLLIDSFNFSKGTYLINFYDRRSAINSLIAKTIKERNKNRKRDSYDLDLDIGNHVSYDFNGYYYLDSLGLHITSKALNEQKISREVISPELLEKNLKIPLLKQSAVVRKILRLLPSNNANSKAKKKK